jgi:hypothetical protein
MGFVVALDGEDTDARLRKNFGQTFSPEWIATRI